MKKLQFLLFAMVSMMFACQSASEYTIQGTIYEMPDGEKLYLYDSKSHSEIDSATVKDGKFTFTGSVEELSHYYLVYKPEGSRPLHKSIWLENKKIEVKGFKEDFGNIKITGTEVQRQEDELSALMEPFEVRMDSIYNVYNPQDTVGAKALNEIYEKVQEQMKEAKVSFVRENPGYFYSMYLLVRLIRDMEPEEGQQLFDGIPEGNKTNEYAMRVKKYLDLNRNLKVGDKFVDLTLNNTGGEPVNLANLSNGKYVLIDFWASWCNPCRKENPVIAEAYSKYKEKGFEVYAVSLDEKKEDWQKAINEDDITWVTVNDTNAFNGEPAMIYSVKYIPHNFLINPEGEIIEIDIKGDEFLKRMEELLGA